jgi:hypothetical protein
MVYSFHLLCPCACAPFCRSKFCLAKTILRSSVMNCDSGGLGGGVLFLIAVWSSWQMGDSKMISIISRSGLWRKMEVTTSFSFMLPGLQGRAARWTTGLEGSLQELCQVIGNWGLLLLFVSVSFVYVVLVFWNGSTYVAQAHFQLTSNSQSTYLSLLSARITGVYYQIWRLLFLVVAPTYEVMNK